MANILQYILDYIHGWWPVRIIKAGYQGVKYTANGEAKLLQPGWHLFIPKLQEIESVCVAYQNTDCGIQSLTTKDGKSISLSCNVGYSIRDAALLWVSFNHFDTSLVNLVREHVLTIVAESTWQELLDDPQGLAVEITEALQSELEPYGVDIEDCKLDQITTAPTLRLLQSQASF